MASMTDVIFLLLIFFMVTSTFVFPTGLEVNLPQSTEQSAVKPMTKVYIDANDSIYASANDEKPQPVTLRELPAFLKLAQQADTTGFIALYADAQVPYGRIVEVLDLGTRHELRMVLATTPVPAADSPAMRTAPETPADGTSAPAQSADGNATTN